MSGVGWYGPPVSLRARRDELIKQSELVGDAFCQAYAAAADEWITSLFHEATGGDDRGLALVAVGGYGRGELCPYSDLDLVLVHRGRRDVAALADRIWYPIWDEGISLDHSVRRASEVLAMAGADLRVALGLLDGRVICGQAKVAEPVLSDARMRWVRQRPPWLGVLSDQVAERHATHGDLGFLLEPDLKESHGGLRDIGALLALMEAVPTLAETVDTGALERARKVLTTTRIELHRLAGRELNTVLLQEQEQVAVACGHSDGDALMRTLATAGRTVAWETDDAWRRRSAWSRAQGRTGRQRRRATDDGAVVPVEGEPGVGVTEDEVVLLDGADVAGDPMLALRVASVAAERDLPIARSALDMLARKAPDAPEPWPDELRALLVRVLATGPAGIIALEALDQRHLLERYLPEWATVRNKPQRNPYHRFTVDRHLLEATANSATMVHRVARSDLLLIGTLLHDIGKGYPGDHTDVGMEVAAAIAARMGLPPEDVAVIVTLVRLHLLLPDTATRRDLDDPATASRVAEAVGSRTTLDLLTAMVEADSLATGSSAWGSWKAGLVADLAERTRRLLAGEPPPEPAPVITDDLQIVMDAVRARGVPALSIDGTTVTVAAPDHPGLLAEVTGVLALHGLDVRSAVVAGENGVAVEIFDAEPTRGRWPQAARLSDDLGAVMQGALALETLLDERAQTYRRSSRTMTHLPIAPQVIVDNDASASATVVEVRAEDAIGQLHRITLALAECGLNVNSAKASTFGIMAVDAFYVTGPDGAKVVDNSQISRIENTILESLGSVRRQ